MSISQLPIFTIVFMLVIVGCDRVDDYKNNVKDPVLKSFQRPANGKLTEQQVADYIVIRQKVIADVKAQKLAKQMTMSEYKPDKSSAMDLLHFDEIEMAAANSFNMSYDEFQWIKDTVITTQTKMLVQRYYDLNHKIMTLLDQTLTHYKEINTEELEQQEQQIMNSYVAEMKQEMTSLRDKITESNERPEALEHNIVIITKFQKELELLQQQVSQSVNP